MRLGIIELMEFIMLLSVVLGAGCKRSPEPPANTPAFEIEALILNTVEVRYGRYAPSWTSSETVTTKDLVIIGELQRVISNAKKRRLHPDRNSQSGGFVDITLESQWTLVIVDKNGDNKEIRTSRSEWYYRDDVLNDLVELSNPEFETFRDSLATTPEEFNLENQ